MGKNKANLFLRHSLPEWLSPHLNELFPAVHAELVPVATTFRVLLPIAHFHGNLAVHILAARWAKAHRRVRAPVV